MESYIKYMEKNYIRRDLHDIVTETSKHPILVEYLKLYLQTDKGKNEINLLNDYYSMTALMWASKYSNEGSTIETVKLLIKNGANINLQNEYGCTALMCASKYSNTKSSIETIKLLIENGANVNLQNTYGDTALMCA